MLQSIDTVITLKVNTSKVFSMFYYYQQIDMIQNYTQIFTTYQTIPSHITPTTNTQQQPHIYDRKY